MKVGKMLKNGIEIKPYVREKKGLYYVVLVYKNAAGKRRDKSFPTKLPVKGNKKKAEAMAKEILENFEIPLEDLYLEDLTADKSENVLGRAGSVIPQELLEKVSLADLTKEQVSNMLFADYMVKYLPIVRMRQIEENTYSGYVGNVRNPIGPYFREKKITLGNLTADDIQDFYDVQLQRVKGNTVNHYHAIIRLALCYARKKGYIKENPIEEVEKPEIEHYVAKVLNASELNKAIEITKDTKLEFPVIFAGVYGLRRSEIVGLRWSSFDFENNIVFVNHKVVTPEVDGVVKIIAKDKGKSDASNRALPLDKDTKARLLAHKEKQEMYQKKFKRAYSKKWLDYVMVDELGELILPNYITSSFNRMVEKKGLKDVRFHDLRHTCASLLLNHGKLNGIGMKDIQVWLGHSDFATTANIYSHVDASSKQASMETISGLVNI
ncbi:MAG: site-specific integrase [Clostridia bacterium]|nr:site-specific integrase [Clostridia bacterium]